jgi:hypothetical protein
MCDAAEQAAVAPRDLSFVNTLKIQRCRQSPRTSPQPNQPTRHQTKDEQLVEKTG